MFPLRSMMPSASAASAESPFLVRGTEIELLSRKNAPKDGGGKRKEETTTPSGFPFFFFPLLPPSPERSGETTAPPCSAYLDHGGLGECN